MKIAKTGDIVLFEYTLTVDNKIIETNIEEAAKTNGIWREGTTYKPLYLLLGTGSVIPGIEEHILERAEVGKGMNIAVPPVKAYGEREPGNIKTIPMAQFTKQGTKPKIGMTLTFEGRKAVIIKVGGGRVTIDSNHALAGKVLEYYLKVVEIQVDSQEKVQTILKKTSAQMAWKWDEDMLTIEVPKQYHFNPQWQMAKGRLVNDIRLVTRNLVHVRFVEDFPIDVPQPILTEKPVEGVVTA